MCVRVCVRTCVRACVCDARVIVTESMYTVCVRTRTRAYLQRVCATLVRLSVCQSEAEHVRHVGHRGRRVHGTAPCVLCYQRAPPLLGSKAVYELLDASK